MPGLMSNTSDGLGEDFQPHNALRTAELVDTATEATVSVKASQERLQATSSQYASNLPSMTHRYRVAPYPTAQQHIAQKIPAQYNPMLNQFPSLQQYGRAMQQGSSAVQNPSASINQISKQAYNSAAASAQQLLMTNSKYLTQQTMQPRTVQSTKQPQTDSYVNQVGQFSSISHMSGSSYQESVCNKQYSPLYPPQNNMQQNFSYQYSSIPRNSAYSSIPAPSAMPCTSSNPDLNTTYPGRRPSLPSRSFPIQRNPSHTLTSASDVTPYVPAQPDLNPTYPQIRPSLPSQSLPIQRNPSRTLTSALDVMPYVPAQPDLSPTYSQRPALADNNINERSLTFPVCEGTILASFRLEHALTVSSYNFDLKPTVHHMLSRRSDLELQLNCFHHEDAEMNSKWPSSVQVSVNETPLYIERGGNETLHKPLFLKQFCRPGSNIIQITTTACCCLYLFSLQLVCQPTISSAVQSVFRKQLLSTALATEKIKRNFESIAASECSTSNVVEGITTLKVSLKCPITFKRIFLPARGQECLHIHCFDLESYIESNFKRGTWKCPICNKPALLQDLEVDEYMWGIVVKLMNTDVEEITIDSTANWKPVHVKSCEEHGGVQCPVCSNFVPLDDVEYHLVMCLTKPEITYNAIQCPVCSKIVSSDDVKCHLVMCLTKPRISYNEDVLSDDKGECVICFEELAKGNKIARLSCLCIYHKSCIDDWFKVNRSCPTHPVDQDSVSD